MTGAVVAWSGGKDCALALNELRTDGVRVAALLTTVNRAHDRSTMHGVRRALHERQAAALGLPVNLVELPPEPSNDAYERVMAREHARLEGAGVDRVVFADLHLEDVRAYREEQLAGTDLEGWWPLWGRDPADVVDAFLDRRYEAVVVAADAAVFEPSAVGRPFDRRFLDDLPAGVDPAGEDGEFHTFVHDGPGFDRPVPVEVGETVTRPVGDGDFHYADLVAADQE